MINIVNSIIESGTITKPYIGVSLYDLGNRYQIKVLLLERSNQTVPQIRPDWKKMTSLRRLTVKISRAYLNSRISWLTITKETV